MKSFLLRFLFLFAIALPSLLVCQIELGDRAFPVTETTLTYGMTTLTLESGRARPVSLGDQRVGFLFLGNGTMTVKVTDPFALQVLDYNLEHGSHSKATRGTITDSFEMMLLTGHPAVEAIPEELSASEVPSKAFETLKDLYLSQLTFRIIPFSLAWLVNNTEEVGAFLHGGKDDWILAFDPVWRQEENLYVLETSTIRRKGASNLRYTHHAISQPLGWDRRAGRSSTVQLDSMSYDLDFTDLSNLRGSYTLGFRVQRPNLTALQLEMVNSWTYFRGSGTGGWALFHEGDVEHDYGSVSAETKYLTIDRVTLDDGTVVPHAHGGDLLTLFLPRRVKKGRPLNLTVEVHGDIFEPSPIQGHHVVLSGFAWYPSPAEGLTAVNALFSGKVRTTRPILAYASVDSFEVTEETKGEATEVTFEGKGSHRDDYHSLVIGKYFPETLKAEGVDVTIASAVFENERAYKLLTGLTEGVLKVYDFFLDDFPYDHLFILEGKGLGYGQAPPATVFASAEIFNSMRDEYTQLFSRGSNELFAHEVAHQYYGHLVRAKTVGDRWLEEAAAEYMAAVFLKHARKKKELKQLYTYWYGRARGTADRASPYSAHLLSGRDADYYYWDVTYCKGPVVLHALREEVGDKAFFTILRSFLKSFPREKASTEDFIGLVNYITKKDFHPFFERYVYGTEMPPKGKKF